ncbi:MAG: hypothetical protein E5V85_16715 [Mesorhizobium sp.]|nr:MAG: hypothetical protein E5V85_16715 [Mesorhizobium sp.]
MGLHQQARDQGRGLRTPLTIVGKRHGDEPPTEAHHFHLCPTCGQAVDRRDLRQVIWHQRPTHEPLEMDS